MSPFTWSPREKKLAIALVAILVFAIGALLWKQDDISLQETSLPMYQQQQPKNKMVEPKKQTPIATIDVKGAVKKPGIYKLNMPVRLYQVIDAAGGTSDVADVNRINLAKIIADGSMIYIPKKGEQIPTEASPIQNKEENKINLNTATLAELEELEGLGPTKAEAIIQYRGEHGGFRSVDELLQVSGIGERTLERIKEKIFVS
ncbi:ComEA family DNA-binding protein [Shimazuella sp. AN120528]|uniref:ComEA family DNA-binding protein n=1 Tax=Shimazuella soli TaxID=1892854 RepID=UPI001F102318|nr:ComEA family DNA-binding protein [Shimazuella soli]MCH5583816.1 ComEA family DNA-binding protein [Shimazuella soli]